MRVCGSTVPDFRKVMRPPPGLCRRCLRSSVFVRVQGYCFFLIFNDRDFLKKTYSRSEHSVDHLHRPDCWLDFCLVCSFLPQTHLLYTANVCPRGMLFFLGGFFLLFFFCFTREHVEFCRGTIGPPSSHQLSRPLLSEEACLLCPRCGSMTISSCWCPGCSATSSRRYPSASSSTSPPQGPLGHTPPFHTSSHGDPEGADTTPLPPSSTFFFAFSGITGVRRAQASRTVVPPPVEHPGHGLGI